MTTDPLHPRHSQQCGVHDHQYDIRLGGHRLYLVALIFPVQKIFPKALALLFEGQGLSFSLHQRETATLPGARAMAFARIPEKVPHPIGTWYLLYDGRVIAVPKGLSPAPPAEV